MAIETFTYEWTDKYSGRTFTEMAPRLMPGDRVELEGVRVSTVTGRVRQVSSDGQVVWLEDLNVAARGGYDVEWALACRVTKADRSGEIWNREVQRSGSSDRR